RRHAAARRGAVAGAAGRGRRPADAAAGGAGRRARRRGEGEAALMRARQGIALALAVVLGLGAGVAFSAAARRPPRAILAELDRPKLPGGFLAEGGTAMLGAACRKRADLELELYQTWPRHPRVPPALEERWAFLENTFSEHERVLAETEELLAQRPPRRLERC